MELCVFYYYGLFDSLNVQRAICELHRIRILIELPQRRKPHRNDWVIIRDKKNKWQSTAKFIRRHRSQKLCKIWERRKTKRYYLVFNYCREIKTCTRNARGYYLIYNGAKKPNFYPFPPLSTLNLNLVTRQIIIPFRSYYAA